MALIKCSECSAEISDKAGRCPKCGAPVVAHKWWCPGCGNMISEDVCPYCGGGSNDIYSTDISGNGSVMSAQPEFVKKNKRRLRVLISVLVIVAAAVIIAAIVLQNQGSGGNSTPQNSHDNCMFIGYADPNRKLDGSTIISSEPKYGYRPVYVDRDDIYNTYHFH